MRKRFEVVKGEGKLEEIREALTKMLNDLDTFDPPPNICLILTASTIGRKVACSWKAVYSNLLELSGLIEAFKSVYLFSEDDDDSE